MPGKNNCHPELVSGSKHPFFCSSVLLFVFSNALQAMVPPQVQPRKPPEGNQEVERAFNEISIEERNQIFIRLLQAVTAQDVKEVNRILGNNIVNQIVIIDICKCMRDDDRCMCLLEKALENKIVPVADFLVGSESLRLIMRADHVNNDALNYLRVCQLLRLAVEAQSVKVCLFILDSNIDFFDGFLLRRLDQAWNLQDNGDKKKQQIIWLLEKALLDQIPDTQLGCEVNSIHYFSKETQRFCERLWA